MKISRKAILIIVSIVIALISTLGNVLTSGNNGVSLIKFESFWFYIVSTCFALYQISKNKKANGLIILALVTYGYTYYLMQKTIDYFEGQAVVTIGTSFYIYLTSAIFLIMALFVDNAKQASDNILNSNVVKKALEEENATNGLNKDNLLFTRFITGIKGIGYNTIVLIVNNETNRTLDLVYNTTNDAKNNQTIKIPFSNIIDISMDSKVGVQNNIHKTEENETKGLLLSAVLFSNNPVMLNLGSGAFSSFLDTMSNNYDKVDYNQYIELVIRVLINGEETKLIFNLDNNPKTFINNIKYK